MKGRTYCEEEPAFLTSPRDLLPPIASQGGREFACFLSLLLARTKEGSRNHWLFLPFFRSCCGLNGLLSFLQSEEQEMGTLGSQLPTREEPLDLRNGIVKHQ